MYRQILNKARGDTVWPPRGRRLPLGTLLGVGGSKFTFSSFLAGVASRCTCRAPKQPAARPQSAAITKSAQAARKRRTAAIRGDYTTCTHILSYGIQTPVCKCWALSCCETRWNMWGENPPPGVPPGFAEEGGPFRVAKYMISGPEVAYDISSNKC